MLEEGLLDKYDSNQKDILAQYQSSNEFNQNEIVFIDNEVTNPEKNSQDLMPNEEKEVEITNIEIFENTDKNDDYLLKDESTFKLLIDIAKGCGKYSLCCISLYIGKPIIKISQKANAKCVHWFGL